MPLHVLVFNLLLGGMCLYASAKGGQPEKLAAFGWALACLATFLVPFDPLVSFKVVNPALVLIDLGVFAGFTAIAMLANRFWPLWLAATQLLAIGVHGVKAYEPALLPPIYAFVLGKLAYPMLAILVVAVGRHSQRLRTYGVDRDWSPRWSFRR